MGRKTPNGAARAFLHEALASDTDDCIMWPFARNPYPTIWWDRRTQYAHVLACEHANGPRPPGTEASHTCGHEACVNPRHVMWERPVENHARRGGHGTAPRGSRNPNARLTEADVKIIKRRLRRGDVQAVIARDFGVGRGTINAIARGRNWQ